MPEKGPASNRSGEEGIALIAVLWALTLLSVMAAALIWEARSGSRIARNMADNAAARAAADAGIQRAILELTSPSPPSTAMLKPDGKLYAWRFANHLVRISIRDEAAKLDINQAAEPVLAAVMASVGVERGRAEALADAIGDYRDPDNLRRPNGAEAGEYEDAGLAWGPKNAPFQSIEELKQVLGMNEAIYRRVEPYLTVYGTAGTISPAANQQLSEVIRRAAGLNAPPTPPTPTGLVFSIHAEARGPSGAVFVREAVVQPSPDVPMPWILSWRQGTP